MNKTASQISLASLSTSDVVQSSKNKFYQVLYHPMLRKVCAVFLCIIGGVGTWNHYHQPSTFIVYAKKTLQPGVLITASMIGMKTVPQKLFSSHVLHSPSSIVNHYVTTPIMPGDYVYSSNILHYTHARHYLPEVLSPRIVPVIIPDSGMIAALKPGLTVDIVSKPFSSQKSTPHILAHNAVVVSIVSSTAQNRSSHSIIYCAMSEAQARTTAMNTSDISFIFH